MELWEEPRIGLDSQFEPILLLHAEGGLYQSTSWTDRMISPWPPEHRLTPCFISTYFPAYVPGKGLVRIVPCSIGGVCLHSHS